MILSRILLFALYVLLVVAGTMWRFADDWGGLPFGERVFLALSLSWKWWLLFCFALLCRDAMRYRHYGLPGDIIVIVIAIVMSVGFAYVRSTGSPGSGPDQRP
jgi:hypothetical protein